MSGYVARAHLAPPSLSIFRSGADVLLCWPSFYGGLVLQNNLNLANSDGWSDASAPLMTNGSSKWARVPITASQFFRLIEK